MAKKGVPKSEILAYTAGIIDGEGYIGISRGGFHSSGTPKYRMRVIVGTTSEELVRLLQYNFGGSVAKRKTTGNRKQQWAWEIAALKAAKFLMKIYPYLLLKRKQAELCLSFQGEGIPMRKATKAETKQRKKVILKIHELNKQGKVVA